MNTIVAAMLVARLAAIGTPARAVQTSEYTAVVAIEGRPGCFARPLATDARAHVIVCNAR
jgi:hypothetical protein